MRKPSYRVGVWGREDSRIRTDVEAGGLLQNAIYVRKTQCLGGRKNIGFWIGFGEVFG